MMVDYSSLPLSSGHLCLPVLAVRPGRRKCKQGSRESTLRVEPPKERGSRTGDAVPEEDPDD
jgi:hypothetical protein